jgi:spore germination protein GerM
MARRSRLPGTLAALAALAVLALAGGCGLRADEVPQPIPRERLDDRLFEDGSGPPGGSLAATIYVLLNQGGTPRLAEVTVPTLFSQNRERAAIEALLGWTPSAVPGSTQRLTSRIPNGTVLRDVRRDGPTLTIDFDDFSIEGTGQALAAAQVVWTATELVGIDDVVFTIDGKPVAVPLGEKSSTPGEPLDRTDFARLNLGPVPTTTTVPPDPPASSPSPPAAATTTSDDPPAATGAAVRSRSGAVARVGPPVAPAPSAVTPG